MLMLMVNIWCVFALILHFLTLGCYINVLLLLLLLSMLLLVVVVERLHSAVYGSAREPR